MVRCVKVFAANNQTTFRHLEFSMFCSRVDKINFTSNVFMGTPLPHVQAGEWNLLLSG